MSKEGTDSMSKKYFEQLLPEQKKIIENTLYNMRFLTDKNKLEALGKMALDILNLHNSKQSTGRV